MKGAWHSRQGLRQNKNEFPSGKGELFVNPDHHLARDLIGCWLPGYAGSVNLARDTGQDCAVLSGAVIGHGSAGPGLVGASGGTGMRSEATPEFTDWSGCTVYYRGQSTGVAVGDAILFSVSYDNALTSPYNVATLNINAGATALQCNSNTGGAIKTFDYGSWPSSGNLISTGATYPGVGGTTRAYQDGLSAGTVAFGGSAQTHATSRVCIHTSGWAVNSAPNATCSLVYFWNRVLSADEMLQLHLDPYSLFLSAEEGVIALPIWFPEPEEVRTMPFLRWGGGARVKRDHPLARGLISCYLPGVYGGSNLGLLAGNDLTAQGNPQIGMGLEGPGLIGDGATNMGFSGDADPEVYGWLDGSHSCYYRGQARAEHQRAAIRQHLARVTWGTTLVAPYNMWVIETNVQNIGPFLYRTGTNTGGSEVAVNNYGEVEEEGSLISLGLTMNSSSTGTKGTLKTYQDGLLVTTSGNVVGAITYDDPQIAIHYVPDTPVSAVSPSAVGYLLYMWNRRLSDSEMLSIHLDPYQIFESEVQSQFIVLPEQFPPDRVDLPNQVGGFGKAWLDYYDDERKKRKKRDFALERIRDSQEYIRLMKKRAMLQEHLLDARSYRETDLIQTKIREVEDRMKSLEMSVLH